MSSKVDVPKARRLRESGQTLEEIGQHFGVSREYIRQLVGGNVFRRECVWCGESFETRLASSKTCSPKCSNRHSYASRRGSCQTCGKKIGPYSVRCIDCARDRWEATRHERYSLIQKLWFEGLPGSEIAERVGYANLNVLGVQIARMKGAGWDIPNRRPGWKNENQHRPTEVPPTTHQQVSERFNSAVRMGKIDRPNKCERCGAEGYVDGHHFDYSKPFEVEWLCRPCHMTEHGKTPWEQAA